MKILQIINSLRSGGAEKLMVDACIKYRAQNIDVDILLLDGTETPFHRTLKEHNDINIITLGGGRNIYNPLNIIKLKSIIKGYDIIHVHLFPASYWVAFSNILPFNQKPIIFTEHNSTNRRRGNPLFKELDRLVYNQFRNVVTISEAVDFNLKNYFGKNINEKVVKIYNGIDLINIETAKPYTKEELGYDDSDILLIQVSSFTPQKDQKTLIKSMNLLPPVYKLLLVGDGPLKDECIEFCKELKVLERVKFLGIRNDVPRLIKSSDLVVLSSHYEGLSLSCIEGMACGKPFLASDSPGLGDIVKNYGLTFETKNSTELSSKILSLMSDKALYNKTVDLCLKRAKKFDINLMVKNYINLFEEIIQ
ncbi:MAG: glycosyltransferase [Flavobacteriaceae bacterium]|nr:glycosyltransferase [Flavobacteriaceae bacterium]